MKRQETIKRSKAEQREEFSDAEVDSLKKSASRMQVNAEFGLLEEATSLFSLMFEKMKAKKFSHDQRQAKVEILNKIINLHNVKCLVDDAFSWSNKALESLESNDPASLVIQTLTNSAKAFTAKSLFDKARVMIEKAVALSAETYGKESRTYAKSLVTYADYLS